MEFSIVPKTIENEIDFQSLRILYPCPWPQFCTNFLKNVKNILMAQLAARLRGVGENIYRLLEEIGQIVVVVLVLGPIHLPF